MLERWVERARRAREAGNIAWCYPRSFALVCAAFAIALGALLGKCLVEVAHYGDAPRTVIGYLPPSIDDEWLSWDRSGLVCGRRFSSAFPTSRRVDHFLEVEHRDDRSVWVLDSTPPACAGVHTGVISRSHHRSLEALAPGREHYVFNQWEGPRNAWMGLAFTGVGTSLFVFATLLYVIVGARLLRDERRRARRSTSGAPLGTVAARVAAAREARDQLGVPIRSTSTARQAHPDRKG